MVGYAATRIVNDPQKDMLENRLLAACIRLFFRFPACEPHVPTSSYP